MTMKASIKLRYEFNYDEVVIAALFCRGNYEKTNTE